MILPRRNPGKFYALGKEAFLNKKKKGYSSDLPKKLYLYFISHEGTDGAPSFHKFAKSIGTTVACLEQFRSRKKFDDAWRECIEIRRDYLKDMALTRRYDPSFVKFLLDEEKEITQSSADSISFTLSVVE